MELREKLTSNNVAIQKICNHIMEVCDKALEEKILSDDKSVDDMFKYVMSQAKSDDKYRTEERSQKGSKETKERRSA